MDVAREQGGADLPFKIIDSPANDFDGQSGRSAADLKLPQRTTSRKTWPRPNP
jgi:hypothetical protein